jgi:hypothetical protein
MAQLWALHISAHGTFQTWRDVRVESVMRNKADIPCLGMIPSYIEVATLNATAFRAARCIHWPAEKHGANLRDHIRWPRRVRMRDR